VLVECLCNVRCFLKVFQNACFFDTLGGVLVECLCNVRCFLKVFQNACFFDTLGGRTLV
jgi:hypothetical protein